MPYSSRTLGRNTWRGDRVAVMLDKLFIFDRRGVRLHRDRAAASLREHDFLVREMAHRLVERLDDIRRKFAVALDLGCRHGYLAEDLVRRGVQMLVHCDLSSAMVRRLASPCLVGDEEALPFAAGSFDLVVSLLNLHWVNDLPGALLQIRKVLKPDGLFLAAMFGGETLKELRAALAEAEMASEGGLSPRISPFAEVRDAGNLLQRAGFTLPVADVETLTVSYADPLALLADLRGMGETNAVHERRKTASRRATLFGALERYRELYRDAHGRVPATFQVIYLTAWAPDASQPRPLRPGSAAARLAEALGSEELPAGDLARP
jgi:NADH dehydrogenase [ubiquinone] 1 alpha subcomplex assembly factor 5